MKKKFIKAQIRMVSMEAETILAGSESDSILEGPTVGTSGTTTYEQNAKIAPFKLQD